VSVLLAQAMPAMGDGRSDTMVPIRPSLAAPRTMLDVGSMEAPPMIPMPPKSSMPVMHNGSADRTGSSKAFVPLGQLAEIEIVEGPPMVRDEDGLLVGYVYVDIDPAKRDIGGYVDEAKRVVGTAIEKGTITVPSGYFLKWTGQYELLEEMIARMKIVIPVTLMIVILLLFLHFKSMIEALIVLLSIPFALVGSAWLMWLLDYRISTAVWVGVIALVGLAAQTGIVMIVYIDNAYERRKRAGKIRDLNDIIWAHMEGTVMRVRPKLMTVSTMLMGLIPLLWATGSGADVMKRIAAPMVGGLITSAFLTLEIIPVVYTYWRQEELLWERLSEKGPGRLFRLKIGAWLVAAGLFAEAVILIVPIYVSISTRDVVALSIAPLLVTIAGALDYLLTRPKARAMIWPSGGPSAIEPA
jgi:Cu(I)/Ag(I) efflux system membrane protein CusA/SilA